MEGLFGRGLRLLKEHGLNHPAVVARLADLVADQSLVCILPDRPEDPYAISPELADDRSAFVADRLTARAVRDAVVAAGVRKEALEEYNPFPHGGPFRPGPNG
jgi:hypothetical protein